MIQDGSAFGGHLLAAGAKLLRHDGECRTSACSVIATSPFLVLDAVNWRGRRQAGVGMREESLSMAGRAQDDRQAPLQSSHTE